MQQINGNSLIKKGFFLLLIFFYLVAGINHFIMPSFYLPLIPPSFGYPILLNILSGLIEISLGLGLVFKPTRRLSCFGIIGLLVLFIPSHVHLIQMGGCIPGSVCVSNWFAYLRLLIIHPILVTWAFYFRNYSIQ